MNNLLIIGKIGSVYGVLGWNKIFSYTEKKDDILKYQPWFLNHKNQWMKFFLEYKKIYNKKIIIKFKNINDRNTAKTLTNSIIAIKKEQLPKLQEFQYYWYHIIHCKVFNKKNIYIGSVNQIMRTKKHDILVLKNKNTQDTLIPFIEKVFIKNIDLNMKIIYLNI